MKEKSLVASALAISDAGKNVFFFHGSVQRTDVTVVSFFYAGKNLKKLKEQEAGRARLGCCRSL